MYAITSVYIKNELRRLYIINFVHAIVPFDMSYDRVFFGGTIITLDESNPIAEALAVKDGLIAAVGDYKDIQSNIGKDTEVIDLKHHTMLPGFIEVHSHVITAALINAMTTDIGGYKYKTYSAVQKKMKEVIANTAKDGWCVFTGWDVELVPDLPELSADYLDTTFSAEVKILVATQTGNSAFANRAALSSSHISADTPDPPGGTYVRDKDGNLTGQLLEEPAIFEVLRHTPLPSIKNIMDAIRVVLIEFTKAGLTTVTEMALSVSKTGSEHAHASGLPLQKLVSRDLDVVLHGIQDEILRLPVRLAYYTIAETGAGRSEREKIVPPPKTGNKRIWRAGYKSFADGTTHDGTAAIKMPYLHSELTEKLSFPLNPNYGKLNWTCDELLQQVKPYHDAGWQVAIHAQGDRAIDQVLQVYEALGGKNRRHRIEHMGLASEDQLAKCALLNASPSMFVSQLYYYGKIFSKDFLGKDYTDNWSPVDFAFKYGCNVSLHQGTPYFPGPPQPLASMKTAVTRTHKDDGTTVYGPKHRISVHQAIQAYTTGPAWQLFRENELGRLKVGFNADLVILSANPYLVDPMKLDDPNTIRVVETYIDGHCNRISM